MEDLVNPDDAWSGLTVLVTGHTGFKGGWLVRWLHRLGADVHGLALDPPTTPNLFEAAKITEALRSDLRVDLRDIDATIAGVTAIAPRIVFHLAAQPLVRASYADPIATWATNVLGTANLLEAVRLSPDVEAVVIVTTDKVYENREWFHPYREADALGGHDPYSASKACTEILAASYRTSFFNASSSQARIATVRAGNVIGGGDWSTDRLVPDCLRAFSQGRPVELRNPNSVRPWQHVIEPLDGYLRLARKLLSSDGKRFARAWNFGPDVNSDATVGAVASRLAEIWGAPSAVRLSPAMPGENPHEAGILRLDSSLASLELGWRPRFGLNEALELTVQWHRSWLDGHDVASQMLEQIAQYQERRLR